MQPELILASASPRRRELLDTMGIRYTIDVADVDESLNGAEAEPVLLLAERKAAAVAPRHPAAYILGADTLVIKDGRMLGKPQDAEDAAQMLRMLRGGWHEVRTGLCLMCPQGGGKHLRLAVTRVHMQDLSEAELLSYIRSGEPMDKAGAYAIQGRGGSYIDRVEGSVSGVIGLPTSVLRQLLNEISFFC